MKVAPYYGCLLSRGEDIVEGEDAENPTGMEAAIRAAGCEAGPLELRHRVLRRRVQPGQDRSGGGPGGGDPRRRRGRRRAR